MSFVMDNDFKTYGFKIIKNFYNINNHTDKNPKLYDYLINTKHLAVMDKQVPGASAFYNNVELCKMHIKSLPVLQQYLGINLYPTYVYARIYNKGADLKRHKDRPACEVSITVNIGYEGNYSWPIFIKDFKGKEHEVTLEPGDGLAYHGCELEHWRNPASEKVINQAQAFLHFVKQDGQFESYIFDNPFLEDTQTGLDKSENNFLSKFFKLFT